MIVVFNKVDAYRFVEQDADDLSPRTRENIPLDELQQTWMARLSDSKVAFVSAKESSASTACANCSTMRCVRSTWSAFPTTTSCIEFVVWQYAQTAHPFFAHKHPLCYHRAVGIAAGNGGNLVCAVGV